MDDQNKSVGERWGRPGQPDERGYAGETPDDRTRALRSDIEHTRAEMSETVDAIQDRLRPRNVVSRAAESVRDAAVGRARTLTRDAQASYDRFRSDRLQGGFIDRVRDNPIPAAVAAGSIAWFVFAIRSGDRRRMPAIYGTTRGGERYIEETTISADVDTEDAGYYADSGDYEDYQQSDYARHARTGAPVRRYAGDVGRRLRRASSSTQSGLERMVRNNPLAVAGIAAAAGALIGLALPETERENELMGEARQSMVERARGAAHEAAGRVQEAAQAAQKVAADVVTRTESAQEKRS